MASFNLVTQKQSPWPLVKLGEVCEFLNGGTPSKSESYFFEGDIPWITGADITGPVVQTARSFITEEAIRKSATNRVPVGTVLLVTRTSVGKVALAGMDLCFSQDITAIKPNDRLSQSYLVQFLRTQEAHFKKQQRGATIQGITRDVVTELKIPLPPLAEQERIAAILDKADALRCLRRTMRARLDELAASLFLDTFGDPATNPKGWPVVGLGEVIFFQEGPGVRDWQFRDEGVKLINVRNLVEGQLVLNNTARYLDPNEVEKKYSHFLLEVGDYVMASSGVTWGKVAEVFPHHLPLCLNTSIIRMRPLDQQVERIYLRAFLESEAFKSQIRRLITGSAQPNFGPSHLKLVEIVLPPLSLQQQFAAQIEETEVLKTRARQALTESEALFAALQQRAFAGEL